MSKVLTPRESSRRARNLDFSVMKGQEFRNIVLVYFPLVVKCIEPDASERRLWLVLSFTIRACVIPNEEYANIDPNFIDECAKKLYVLYEELFHARNCSYNTHTVFSHLTTIRVHGPLTLTSAFGFESFYGEMRHSFTPGTTSTLKQIMQRVLLKRAISPHVCQKTIYYSAKDTSMESNSLVYIFQDNEYIFYKIISIDDDSLYCKKVEKHEASFPETPELNWSSVGVFKAGDITDELITLNKQNVSGKFQEIDDLFITVPVNVLQEN